MREKQLQKNEESYHKYMYALKLRREAADQIGIDNIRLSRIARLAREEERKDERYRCKYKDIVFYGDSSDEEKSPSPFVFKGFGWHTRRDSNPRPAA